MEEKEGEEDEVEEEEEEEEEEERLDMDAEHDYFGKDAIRGLYKEIKFTVDTFTEGEHTLRLPRDHNGNPNPVPRH